MKYINIKIFHLWIVLYVLLLFWGHETIFRYLDFLFSTSEENSIKNIFDSEILKFTISILFLLLLPILNFNKFFKNILKNKLDITALSLSLIIFILIFSPLLINQNPEFYRNIGVTKLKEPLSSIFIIHLKEDYKNDYIEKRKKLIQYDLTNIIYCDKYSVDDKIIYYQKGKEYFLNKIEIEFVGNNPKIENKIFLAGTDEFGRDNWSRLIVGMRLSLLIGIGAAFISLLIGVVFGFISGFYGGLSDSLLGRFTDGFTSLPAIFIILLVISFWSSSILIIILLLGITGWMGLYKLIRSNIIIIKQKDYLQTAIKIGLPTHKIFIKELFPNLFPMISVYFISQCSNVILAEAALSYLGLGSGTEHPSWGSMIESGQQYINHAWWMITFPGIFLTFTLLTANNFSRKLNRLFNTNLSL